MVDPIKVRAASAASGFKHGPRDPLLAAYARLPLRITRARRRLRLTTSTSRVPYLCSPRLTSAHLTLHVLLRRIASHLTFPLLPPRKGEPPLKRGRVWLGRLGLHLLRGRPAGAARDHLLRAANTFRPLPHPAAAPLSGLQHPRELMVPRLPRRARVVAWRWHSPRISAEGQCPCLFGALGPMALLARVGRCHYMQTTCGCVPVAQ